MIGRNLTFTFAGITLSAVDYNITAKDKLLPLIMTNGIIRTVVAGKSAAQIKISGQLPACESNRLFEALEPLIGIADKQLLLDGAEYKGVTLDACTVAPSDKDGFARFTLEFHF